MDKSDSSIAQQIAQAACAFERQSTGHVPQSVTVVLCEEMLFITVREALSPAEQVLARSQSGAAQVREFHHHLFAGFSQSLYQEIQRITAAEIREATVQVFTTGTAVLMFLLTQRVPSDTWSGPCPQA